MPFPTGFRRPTSTDDIEAWRARLEPTYIADHPRFPDRYNTYLHFVAFLAAGSIEQQWPQGTLPGGRVPFVPRGQIENFIPGLHKEIHAFRESRHINGLGSSKLTEHSYRLLSFLDKHVPSSHLERLLAIARSYIKQNESECLLM